jgi:hypothetical protein
VIRCLVINRGGCGNAVNVAAYRSPLKLARRRPYQPPAGLFVTGFLFRVLSRLALCAVFGPRLQHSAEHVFFNEPFLPPDLPARVFI